MRTSGRTACRRANSRSIAKTRSTKPAANRTTGAGYTSCTRKTEAIRVRIRWFGAQGDEGSDGEERQRDRETELQLLATGEW